MEFNDYKDLLKRYYIGECSDIEKQLVETWYDSFEGGEQAIEGLPDMEEKIGIQERLIGRLSMHIQTPSPIRKRSLGWVRPLVKVAAAIVLLLCGTWWLMKPFGLFTSERHKAAQALQHFSAGPGARKTLKLSDGSTITLNANSSLDIMAGYGDKQRLVLLKGEAFFHVKPAVKCPFYIQTKDVSVQVLGTSFNVKAYDHRAKVQVAVKTGKVQINDAADTREYLLGEGEKYDYDRTGKRFVKRNGGSDGAWLNGDIGLARAPFLDLALSFQDVYGVRLHSHDAIVLKSQYTLKLKYQRSAVQTAQVICSMLNKQYRKEENGDLTIF
ncbi:MAG TPA: FecR domain-containing protein [Pseudosphingobacterium sp.]|nr:FecR domain-containing protein [Pseudosphingobacterium sp.]